MAGKLTYAGAAVALDAVTGRQTVNSRTVYLALLTAAPDEETTLSTMSEASFTYTRPAVSFDAPSGGPVFTDNTSQVSIGPLADADGEEEVTHWALVTAASGTSGDVLAYGDWDTPRSPNLGDTLVLGAGDLDITIDPA